MLSLSMGMFFVPAIWEMTGFCVITGKSILTSMYVRKRYVTHPSRELVANALECFVAAGTLA